MSKINVLFLSDLHFHNPDATSESVKQASQNDKLYAKALCEGIKGNVPEECKPSIIAICGDVAFSGLEREYEFFTTELLNPLKEIFSIGDDHVIICPGNHDKNDRIYYRYSDVGARLKARSKNESVYDDPNDGRIEEYNMVEEEKNTPANKFEDICEGLRLRTAQVNFILDYYRRKPFLEYEKFLSRNNIYALSTDCYSEHENSDHSSYLYGYRKIDDIGFYLFNTAWDCLHYGKKGGDKGYLRVGPYVKNIGNDDRITIAMMHHPTSWLVKGGFQSFYTMRPLGAERFSFFITGHEHDDDAWLSAEGTVTYISLPTLTANDTPPENWKCFIIQFLMDEKFPQYNRYELRWAQTDNKNHITIGNVGGTNYVSPGRVVIEEKLDNISRFEGEISLLIDLIDEYKRTRNKNLIQMAIAHIQRVIISLVESISNKAYKDKLHFVEENIKFIMNSDEPDIEEERLEAAIRELNQMKESDNVKVKRRGTV